MQQFFELMNLREMPLLLVASALTLWSLYWLAVRADYYKGELYRFVQEWSGTADRRAEFLRAQIAAQDCWERCGPFSAETRFQLRRAIRAWLRWQNGRQLPDDPARWRPTDWDFHQLVICLEEGEAS